MRGRGEPAAERTKGKEKMVESESDKPAQKIAKNRKRGINDMNLQEKPTLGKDEYILFENGKKEGASEVKYSFKKQAFYTELTDENGKIVRDEDGCIIRIFSNNIQKKGKRRKAENLRRRQKNAPYKFSQSLKPRSRMRLLREQMD